MPVLAHPQTLTVRIAQSLRDVEAARWDACANPAAPALASKHEGLESLSQSERFNPFITHAFLLACETSKSTGGRTGWGPVHLLIEDAEKNLLACAPAYLKSHSQGEYVFDHGWAEALERAGGRYYPKVQIAVPFTPAPGRRLLVAPGPRADVARATLIAGADALRDKAGASSVHATFLPKAEWDLLGEAGFLQRTGEQFHFLNEGYATFEAFLNALASRKRKMIRRERAEALAPGIEIERLTGTEITEGHWDAFYEFYMDTGSRKWGRPYLTRAFFSEVGAALSARILLVMAKRAGRYIAGAINFIGDDALYGRNWGAIEHHPFLHFELCYYQAIDFAISRGLKRVEAGAQGEHKLARGYRPVPTYSAHSFADPRMTRAIKDYLVRERAAIAQSIEADGEHVPFRKGGGASSE